MDRPVVYCHPEYPLNDGAGLVHPSAGPFPLHTPRRHGFRGPAARPRRHLKADPSARECGASLDKLLLLKAHLVGTNRLIGWAVYRLYGPAGKEITVAEGGTP